MIKGRPALRGSSRMFDEKDASFVTVIPDLLITLVVRQTLELFRRLIIRACSGLGHFVFGVESDAFRPLLKLRILVILVVGRLAPQKTLIHPDCFNRRA